MPVNVENAVISPGGSVVYCAEAMQHYKEIGTVVYLKVSYEIIQNRIKDPKKRGVVLAEGQTLKMLYDERSQLFEKYADVVIDEGSNPIEETIERVLATFEQC